MLRVAVVVGLVVLLLAPLAHGAPSSPPSPSTMLSLPPSAPTSTVDGPLLAATGGPVNWPTYLYNPERTGENSQERTIAPSNVSHLEELWSVPSNASDFSAPIVVNNTVYYGSWNGYEYAVNAANGSIEWQTYLGVAPCVSGGISSTPAYLNGTLYLGGGDGYWYALNATNGSVDWDFLAGSLANHYYDWASALVYHNSLYIGLSSCYDDPLIFGQLLEVNITVNHTVSHSFDTVPVGEIGGSIWTTPAVDPQTNTVWVTTGNEESGYPPYVNSIIGLNATTLNLSGSWQVPNVQGQDSDFGSTPNLIRTPSGLPLVIATNKNGEAYALNRSNVTTNGSWGPIWSLDTGGGFSSGAYDGHTLYLAGGSTLFAVDPVNGSVLWSTTLAGFVYGSLTWANGLVYVGAGSNVEAIDAANGRVLWNYPLGGGYSTVTEPVVDDGRLYVASGNYASNGNLTAFGLNFTAQANATPPNGTVPLPVSFTASAAGGMTPYSFIWNFGDGSNGSGPDVAHTFGTAGNYTVRVWINDSAGASVNASFPIQVNPLPRDPGLAASILVSTALGLMPLTVSFVGYESNGTLPPYTFSWTFGDGANSSGMDVSHTFTTAGTYPVELTVRDRVGNSASANTTIEAVALLDLTAAANPNPAVLDQAILFSAVVTGGLAPYTYAWAFGDGSPGSNLSAPYHTFTSVGNFTASLTVTDGLHERKTVAFTVQVPSVTAPLSVGAAYEYFGGPGCNGEATTPLEIQFTGAASGGVAPFNYSWAFNDGRTAWGTVVMLNASADLTEANLTVHDARGTTNSTTLQIFPEATAGCPSIPEVVNGWFLVLAGIVIAAVVGLVLLVVRRRGNPPPPPA